MTVLVTGAGGTLGRLVVGALTARGVQVRGTGRGGKPTGSTGEWVRVDLLGRTGLTEALTGVAAVVHCATNPRRPADDERMFANLVEAVRSCGAHLVYVGISGIENAATVLPYYRAKLANEEHLLRSDIPHTICRATQFHPFLDQVLRRLSMGPVQLCPAMRLQPVEPSFVAERLAEHCLARTVGRAPDLSGPETLTTKEVVAPWLRSRGGRRLRVPLPRIGALSVWSRLMPATGEHGGRTWKQWLSGKPVRSLQRAT